ncbi:MAG: hypothetical protein HOW73_22605 [Polyangiaceae bacterium]|nr:hypothetical protein [Polyangiaceae bacterium]
MTQRDGPYRVSGAAPDSDAFSLRAMLLTVVPVALGMALFIVLFAKLALGLRFRESLACAGIAFIGAGVVLVCASYAEARSRLRQWKRIGALPCPSCDAPLGLASLFAGATSGRNFRFDVGEVTTARCASCGSVSEWLPWGELVMGSKHDRKTFTTVAIVSDCCPVGCGFPVALLRARSSGVFFCYCDACEATFGTPAESQFEAGLNEVIGFADRAPGGAEFAPRASLPEDLAQLVLREETSPEWISVLRELNSQGHSM